MRRPYRSNGPKALAPSIDKITRRLFGKRGFTEAAVLNDWPSVVGEDLARHCLPEKITYPDKSKIQGTLRLRVANGAFAVEMQHMEPVIIERINAFFGYRAVARLHLVQAPLPQSSSPSRSVIKAQKQKKEPDRAPPVTGETAHDLDNVQDPELKAALEALGRAITPPTTQ
ncbi:DUF721 domain-containing protein [Varunaivibrio sulfuroxidans]|uniref:Nucleic acid-binding Zn ribbon protein n=1 Tax=Varunaivibrio sulfuroxidans TaxID=1773489 RepID=A0A4R3J9G0_9PROT|nr:DUF721 domain-containing protein [Varunaivibrio sulfuroxidans]TCS62212.1 hypothetical protein EDD55_106170 [Varunaivibrio sulfuroxidans]WES30637.1 DUF721 domain-containing protein [Varunaivibrio sulfuroxidans]